MSDETSLNQTEHELISTAIDLETLEVNLFRSTSLWIPIRGRGVFGGQVISQALVAATKCVDSTFALHSMHCYFLLSVSSATPIVYSVDRIRTGRSYATRSVRAVQGGKIVFVLLCSFQKPEPWQPAHQWMMPPNIPAPEVCELEEVRLRRLALREGLHEKIREFNLDSAAERERSPIAVKIAKEKIEGSDGVVTYMYWMKAKNIPKYDASFQKCILAYLSDLYLISTAPRILGLKRHSKGENATSMISTLDHSIFFYDDNFDCGDWLLYVMQSPRIGSGRGVMHGRLHTRTGTLVAVTTQEGVVRADIRAAKPKL